MRGGIKGVAEYALALLIVRVFGAIPRKAAHRVARSVGWLGFHLAGRQRRAGLRNLQLAFPNLTNDQHEEILRGSFQNLARLLVEFTHFPELHKNNISEI